ncbi:hypothetical protein BH23GEM11_BH23GEM11_02080 [soil metagenome]
MNVGGAPISRGSESESGPESGSDPAPDSRAEPRPPLFTDSRRVFGPTPWLDGPGVVMDVPAPHGHDPALIEAWAVRVAEVRAARGWTVAAPGPLVRHRHASGTILGFPAPPLRLLAATSLAEWALEAAARALKTPFDPGSLDPEPLPAEPAAALAALRAQAAAEAVGPADELLFETPAHIPVALVTGSNGKTTTTRLLAAMLRDHGHLVGFTSTDGVQVGTTQVERGDWSGPRGAARVLGDASVTAAVLEIARGGLLRRGLVVGRADVAVITNVAEDHFGEYGVDTMTELARVKGLVARALGPGNVLVLNGDDPLLSPEGPDDPEPPPCTRPCRDDIRVVRFSMARPWPAWLPAPEEIPLTAGGLAQYNAANALAASLAARTMGVPEVEIARTLRRFGTDPGDNPGRLVREEVGGVTLLFDYAHNPAGLSALLEVARGGAGEGTPAEPSREGGRMLLLLGQAGDRPDDAIRELARVAWSARPDRVILREVAGYTRGRARGEVPGILARELARLGAEAGRIHTRLDEHEAVEEGLAWARPGDLLVLPIHGLDSRARMLTLVAHLRAVGWQAGDPVPTDGRA